MTIPPLRAVCSAAVLLTLGLASSCQNPIALRSSERYSTAGYEASRAGNHWHALEMYGRSRRSARHAGADGASRAYLEYRYGNELALVGDFERAEEHLLWALRRYRALRTREPAYHAEVAATLGRIHLDNGRPDEALDYFREMRQVMDELPPERVDPVDRLYLLRDYMIAARGYGTYDEIRAIESELLPLAREHGEAPPTVHIDRFTPEDVEQRLAADDSPERYRPGQDRETSGERRSRWPRR